MDSVSLGTRSHRSAEVSRANQVILGVGDEQRVTRAVVAQALRTIELRLVEAAVVTSDCAGSDLPLDVSGRREHSDSVVIGVGDEQS